MQWIILIIAGLFETAFAFCLVWPTAPRATNPVTGLPVF
jgi:multidrug transporter EmrE-like cation transporter